MIDFPGVRDHIGRNVRLATIVRLRWIAVAGQLLTLGFVHFWLGFDLPLAYCMALVALSAWLNVFLVIQFPPRHRLTAPFAATLLTYDMLQLAVLLYFTGGIGNPFVMLIVAPCIVSAATLPVVYTAAMCALTLLATYGLTYEYWPMPWYDGIRFELPLLYKTAILTSVGTGLLFVAFYVRRLAHEGREMSAALAATELILAREQKLHALDGLAAAAAHELGTPLSTIYLIARELQRDLGPDHRHAEDLALLQSQSDRCREILRKLTRTPDAQDPMHQSVSIIEVLSDAASPYRELGKKLDISGSPVEGAQGQAAAEPVGLRQPGLHYGLGNIIENAVDFAKSQVDITARWDGTKVTVEIVDDGPGFKPDLIDSIGDPYVTSRGAGSGKASKAASGLGLGFFIAKTLLERSGAFVELENRKAPATGAKVRLTWPRDAFAVPDGWRAHNVAARQAAE
ncbi:MAG: ActS/PrrB/RegB family redox-sensitive histidine kinase [Alphaproteobacteria bacterium]|nr:ActS/PrrB/RegB family redox-sensitive histidine kinase [Alphaproteobacteria bacterium]